MPNVRPAPIQPARGPRPPVSSGSAGTVPGTVPRRVYAPPHGALGSIDRRDARGTHNPIDHHVPVAGIWTALERSWHFSEGRSTSEHFERDHSSATSFARLRRSFADATRLGPPRPQLISFVVQTIPRVRRSHKSITKSLDEVPAFPTAVSDGSLLSDTRRDELDRPHTPVVCSGSRRSPFVGNSGSKTAACSRWSLAGLRSHRFLQISISLPPWYCESSFARTARSNHL